MKKTQEKVAEYLKKQALISCGDKILVGVSGGADSVCLFYLLKEIKEELDFSVRVVHVHHGIRPEAEGDVSYVEELCHKEGVVCRTFREDVPQFAKKGGYSEEEAGRILRYQDFQKALEEWQMEEGGEAGIYKIAVAHHADDQAETVLFQLFRGSGIAGLRGILPRRGNIIRPLLCLSRIEIEDYLKEKGVFWCEDVTNASEQYSRNKIRLEILPLAEKEICKNAAAHIVRSAEVLREAECYIRRRTEEAFLRAVTGKQNKKSEIKGITGDSAPQEMPYIVLNISDLIKEEVFLQKQLILYCLEQITASRKDIGSVHVEDILKLVQKQGNGELMLPEGVVIRKTYEKLLFIQNDLIQKERVQSEISIKEKGMEEILMESRAFLYGEKMPLMKVEKISLSDKEELKKRFLIDNPSDIMKYIPQKTYTKWFDYDKIETPYLLRHRKNGDYLTINSAMERKSIKKYMIQEKLPASVRDKVWLLADGMHIMWVPGGRISAYYKVTDQTKTILQVSIDREETEEKHGRTCKNYAHGKRGR